MQLEVPIDVILQDAIIFPNSSFENDFIEMKLKETEVGCCQAPLPAETPLKSSKNMANVKQNVHHDIDTTSVNRQKRFQTPNVVSTKHQMPH